MQFSSDRHFLLLELSNGIIFIDFRSEYLSNWPGDGNTKTQSRSRKLLLYKRHELLLQLKKTQGFIYFGIEGIDRRSMNLKTHHAQSVKSRFNFVYLFVFIIAAVFCVHDAADYFHSPASLFLSVSPFSFDPALLDSIYKNS